MISDVGRLESLLARNAREFLKTRNRELERSLSSDFEYLLQYHWHDHGQSEYIWFDGLDSADYSFRPPLGLSVLGLMWWGDTGTTEEWIDVFSADLTLAEQGDMLASYTLKFGIRGKEGRKDQTRRQLLRELQGMSDDEWGFVFTGPVPG